MERAHAAANVGLFFFLWGPTRDLWFESFASEMNKQALFFPTTLMSVLMWPILPLNPCKPSWMHMKEHHIINGFVILSNMTGWRKNMYHINQLSAVWYCWYSVEIHDLKCKGNLWTVIQGCRYALIPLLSENTYICHHRPEYLAVTLHF